MQSIQSARRASQGNRFQLFLSAEYSDGRVGRVGRVDTARRHSPPSRRFTICQRSYHAVSRQPLPECICFRFVYCPKRTKSDTGKYFSDSRRSFLGENAKTQAAVGMILVCRRRGATAGIQAAFAPDMLLNCLPYIPQVYRHGRDTDRIFGGGQRLGAAIQSLR